MTREIKINEASVVIQYIDANMRKEISVDGEYVRINYFNANGELHREDGPAEEWVNRSKYWCINGKRHRPDGPAIEYADGSKYWYVNGKRHRLDGPAEEWPDGTKDWWVNGKHLSEQAFNELKGKQEKSDMLIIEGQK